MLLVIKALLLWLTSCCYSICRGFCCCQIFCQYTRPLFANVIVTVVSSFVAFEAFFLIAGSNCSVKATIIYVSFRTTIDTAAASAVAIQIFALLDSRFAVAVA